MHQEKTSLMFDRLKALPDDIILSIPSIHWAHFQTFLSFALSCRRVNELLDDYTPSMYRQLGKQEIEFESHARALLRDQKGLEGLALEPTSLKVNKSGQNRMICVAELAWAVANNWAISPVKGFG